jgi:hypothetical protein
MGSHNTGKSKALRLERTSVDSVKLSYPSQNTDEFPHSSDHPMPMIYINAGGERSNVVDSFVLPESMRGSKSALDYLFTQIGLVSAQTRHGNNMEVTLRASRVSPAAYAALLYLFFDCQPPRVILNYYDEEKHTWNHKLIGDWRAATEWVLLQSTPNLGDGECILTSNRPIEKPCTKNSLKAAVHIWKQREGLFDDHSFNTLVNSILLNHYVLLTQDLLDPVFRIEKVGHSIPESIRASIERICGDSVWSLPDRTFAVNCHQTYSLTAAINGPMLEDVDAYVYWPKIGYRRRRYQRLVLPIKRYTTPILSILSATSSDCGIDLRNTG